MANNLISQMRQFTESLHFRSSSHPSISKEVTLIMAYYGTLLYTPAYQIDY